MIRVLATCALAACSAPPKRPLPPEVPPTAKVTKPTLEAFGGSAELEVLLDERAATAAGMGPLVEQLAVSPKQLAVISDRKKLYLIGWGGTVPVDALAGIDDFAYTHTGLLLAIRGRDLVYLTDTNTLAPLFGLPNDGMRLATGTSSMFLFDTKTTDGHNVVYELTEGKKVRPVFDSPDPIEAVAQGAGHLYVASSSVVFEATPGGQLQMIAALPGAAHIHSMAVMASGKLYVSDGDTIYVLTDGNAAVVSKSLGGALLAQGPTLLVLDPSRKLLARITGLR